LVWGIITSYYRRLKNALQREKGHYDDKNKKVMPPAPNVEGFSVSKDVNMKERAIAIASAQTAGGRAERIEPSDIILNSPRALPKPTNAYEDITEPREIAYYPAGRNSYGGGGHGSKPNIEAIRQWVSNTKVATSSNFILSEEFGEKSGFVYGKTGKELEHAIDEIAFKVARKIWYVGRKPSTMKDFEWDQETRHMRPAEGSFSKNEKWVNGFPYGETYMYRSGYLDQ
tara:strand:+ start:88 stop:771 length:684 start_codon:yes stop_codon:yes gene_type:complete